MASGGPADGDKVAAFAASGKLAGRNIFMDGLYFVICFFGLWLLLQLVILPKLGVPT